ncbi:MAG: DUF3108 domain-containing protein [Bacteroidota bacterium]
MRVFLVIVFCSLLRLWSFSQGSESIFGEQFLYKINYGWISIGEARFTHHPGEGTLGLDVLAQTTGIINWIARLKDSLYTVVNVRTLKPITTFQDRNEGKYNRKESDYFDFEMDSATIFIHRRRKDEAETIERRSIHLKDSTYDMLSGYAYLRSQNWNLFQPKDSLMFNMFYEGKYYDFGVEYIEKTVIETSLGIFPAHLAYILFPLSSTFPEKHMVKVWMSADDRKWPLQIEAKMKFGKAICELVEVQ